MAITTATEPVTRGNWSPPVNAYNGRRSVTVPILTPTTNKSCPRKRSLFVPSNTREWHFPAGYRELGSLSYLPRSKSSPRLDSLRFSGNSSSTLIDESRSPNRGARCRSKTVRTVISIGLCGVGVERDCLVVVNLSLLSCTWGFSGKLDRDRS